MDRSTTDPQVPDRRDLEVYVRVEVKASLHFVYYGVLCNDW